MEKTVEFSPKSVLAVQLPKIAYARWNYDAGHMIGVHFRICGAGDFFSNRLANSQAHQLGALPE